MGSRLTTIFDVGLSANGDCEVKGTSSEAMHLVVPGLETSLTGPGMVEFQASNIPPNWGVMALFALSKESASFSPAQLHVEGSYEYDALGQVVSRHLKFTDRGGRDLK